jgi:hypothetical protein
MKMLVLNEYLMLKLSNQIQEAKLHEAEQYRLVKMCRQENPSWFTRFTAWLITSLGQLMLKWGAQLQNYSFQGREHKVRT